MARLLRYFLILPVLVAILARPGAVPARADVAAPDLSATTASGVRLEVFSELSPLTINRIHSWRIRLRDADGSPFEARRLELTGGMPEHDHGLPTVPGASPTDEPGEFLLEGLRFHMPGLWRLDFTLVGAQGSETVSLEFSL